MKILLLVFALIIPQAAFCQNWSGVLDPTRAFDWQSNAGFTIPTVAPACPTQPTLATGSGAAAANTTSINAALASGNGTNLCSVNLPAGTYYANGWQYTVSNVVMRGASPNTDPSSGGTYMYISASGYGGCGGYSGVGWCAVGSSTFNQSTSINPGAGNNACAITGGYTQGSTSITINSCGNPPPAVGHPIVIDQADDATDNGGVALGSSWATTWAKCPSQKGCISVNADGRTISGVQYSLQLQDIITSISGSGPWTVALRIPIPFNNFRSGQTPGMWWSYGSSGAGGVSAGYLKRVGIENMTIDYSLFYPTGGNNIGGLFLWCDQPWMQGVRSLWGANTNHVDFISDVQPVVQNNYFFGSAHLGSSSYCVQMFEISGALVWFNIMQNVTSPDIKDAVTASVSAYNFTPFVNFGFLTGTYLQGMYMSHNSGSAFNLLEGNMTTNFQADDIFGTSDLITVFRNHATGFQTGFNSQTYPISINRLNRGFNFIGNVLGQTGYSTNYATYATSTTQGAYISTPGGSPTVCGTAGSSCGPQETTIYSLGWSDTAGLGNCQSFPGTSSGSNDGCDSITQSSVFLWGNYDTVTAANQFNNSESAPGAIPYINAQSTPGSHTLAASWLFSSAPTQLTGYASPLIGPEVTSGNIGICTSGTYTGYPALTSGQCGGGSFTAHAWGGHVNANPAQVCYLNTMGGPPDGGFSVAFTAGDAHAVTPLAFNSSTCYAAAPPPSPGSQGVLYIIQ